MKTLLIAAAAAAFALAAPAAFANEQSAAVVSFGDLNLTHSGDARVMMTRLDRAAMKTCGASEFSLREVREAVRKDACYQDSLARAVNDLNAPSVTAIYRQQVEMKLASN